MGQAIGDYSRISITKLCRVRQREQRYKARKQTTMQQQEAPTHTMSDDEHAAVNNKNKTQVKNNDGR